MRTSFASLLLIAACNSNSVGVGAGSDGGGTIVPDAGTTTTLDGGHMVIDAASGGGTADARPGLGADETFGPADGLDEPIADVSVDGAGNVWAVGVDKLYLLKPGAKSFLSFTNADGLHVVPFTGPDGSPDISRLTAVAGAGPNELYLGYHGYESDDPYGDTEAQKELGNGDRITFDPATNKLTVLRYFFRCIVEVNRCWEDRSVRRVIVAHSGAAAGHAFFGFNHGATHVFNDVLGDHVHPEINWVNTDGTILTRYGESQALAVEPDGTVWVGNRYGVGLMNWNPDPIAWVSAKFKIAFTTYTEDHGLDVPWGYTEDNIGAAVTGDGTVWLASDTRGLASYDPTKDVSTIKHWDGVPHAVDVWSDVDNTLWLVGTDGALVHFSPVENSLEPTSIGDANRIYLDRSVNPRVLWVARDGGISAFVK